MKLLLLSDIQGNITALDAVLANAASSHADEVICLGDVACGPYPAEVLARLHRLGARSVRGNMDEVIAAPTLVPGGDAVARRFGEIDRWSSSCLTEEQRDGLGALPLTLEMRLPGDRALLACHGSPLSVDGVIGPDTPTARVESELAGYGVDLLLVGHLHDPMLLPLPAFAVVNPGSVGWPSPRDNLRPTKAHFAVLEFDGTVSHISFHTVDYPVDRLRNDVVRSGMPHSEWYLQQWRDV